MAARHNRALIFAVFIGKLHIAAYRLYTLVMLIIIKAHRASTLLLHLFNSTRFLGIQSARDELKRLNRE